MKSAVSKSRDLNFRHKKDFTSAKLDLAFAYQRQNKLAQAKPLFDELFQKKDATKDQKFQAKLDLASVYQRQNKLAQAESLLNELLQEKVVSKDQKFQAKLNLASVYQQRQQSRKAESLLNELLQEKDISKDQKSLVKLNLANFYNANGQYAKSSKLYNEFISDYKEAGGHFNEPKHIKDNLFIIQNLVEYEKIREITIAVNKDSTDEISVKFPRMQIDPQSSFTYNLWGNIYLEKGEYERAIEEFQKAISIESRSLIAHTGLKDAYIKKREYIKALIEFNKIEKLSVTSPYSISFRPAYNNLGNIYADFEQPDIEIKKILLTFKAMIKILPRHSDVLYAALGAIYFHRGLYKEAERFFGQSIACQTSDDAHRDLGYIGMGRIYLNKGLISKGITNFKIALEFNSRSAFAYEGLGIAYDKYLNNRNEAIFYYKKYLESDGASEEIKKRLLELEKEGAKDE